MSILAGTAVALVMAAATTAGANPNYPGVGERNAPSRDAGTRSSNMFSPSDATTRSRAVTPRQNYQSQQPDARIISTPNLPAAAPAEPVDAPLRMIAPAPAQTVVNQEPVAPPLAAPAAAPPVMAPQAVVPPPAPPASMAAPAPVAAPAVAAPVVSEPPARAAVPSFTASDSEIANKVRELIARKQLERIAPRKNERDAIEAFYVKKPQRHAVVACQRPAQQAHQGCGRAPARHRRRRPRSRRVFAAGSGIER